MTKLSIIAIVLCSIFATACGQATTMVRDQHAGSIALEGSYMQAMGDARLMMAEHCQGRFDVLETEGELHYRCRGTDELHTAVASR